MLTEERPPVGVMRGSGGTATTTTTTRVGGRIRPPWLLTLDDLPSIPAAGSASPHQKQAARFALDDLLSPSSGVRRGTGAFLPCVQMQSHPPLPQPVPRPSGKAAARPQNNTAAANGFGAGSNKKKPRPSPPTPTPGGPGMHAVFIDSPSSRPSGTGVFLPRSAGADQLLQHTSQQQKRPPVTSSRVLLPARLFRLLNHRVLANQDAPTPPPTAAAAMINHTAGPPHQLSSPPIKGGDKDKAHNRHHQPQQNRGEGGKRGTEDDAALYDHGQGDYPYNNASGATANKKCADSNYTASTTLIENLLPEEWIY